MERGHFQLIHEVLSTFNFLSRLSCFWFSASSLCLITLPARRRVCHWVCFYSPLLKLDKLWFDANSFQSELCMSNWTLHGSRMSCKCASSDYCLRNSLNQSSFRGFWAILAQTWTKLPTRDKRKCCKKSLADFKLPGYVMKWVQILNCLYLIHDGCHS